MSSSSTTLLTLPTNPFGSTITGWRWDFNDQSFSSFQNPGHGYIQPRFYNIGLQATTNLGCSASTTKVIRVGDVPEVKFDYSALCNNDKTKFVDESLAGISNIVQYTWDFDDGTVITGPPNGAIVGSPETIGTFDKPDHLYTVDGSYNAKLTILTDDGCQNSLTKLVNIFSYVTVKPAADSAYFQNFQKKKSGWLPEALLVEKGITNQNDSLRYSWMRTPPNGVNIKPIVPGDECMVDRPSYHIRSVHRRRPSKSTLHEPRHLLQVGVVGGERTLL